MQFAMRIQIEDDCFLDDPERLAKMIDAVSQEVRDGETSGVISDEDGNFLVGDWTINE